MSGASPASNYITTHDGLRLYYEVWGEGPSDLIVPNGMGMRRDYRPLTNGRRLIVYDVRNRGGSETVTDPAKLERGILNDLDDLDTVRLHFGLEKIDLLGHSYIGMLAALYAMRHPEHTGRVMLIGPVAPHADTQYPPHLAYSDDVLQEILAGLGALQNEAASADPVELCRRFWTRLRRLYVFRSEDADKIDWSRCDSPNERAVMVYWTRILQPSIQRLRFTDSDFARATAPVLVIHGDKDRSGPYGGGREWALRLPNARLLTVRDAAHAPWVEAPELVYRSMETFLSGDWPKEAERVTALDPGAHVPGADAP